jgi:hypothetical protein
MIIVRFKVQFIPTRRSAFETALAAPPEATIYHVSGAEPYGD